MSRKSDLAAHKALMAEIAQSNKEHELECLTYARLHDELTYNPHKTTALKLTTWIEAKGGHVIYTNPTGIFSFCGLFTSGSEATKYIAPWQTLYVGEDGLIHVRD